MSRLINTEEFIKRIDHYPPDIRDTAKKELRYCKTVDAVPVVRCKNCEYGEIEDPEFPDQYFCHAHGCDWNEGDHFCSNGKEKVKERR